MPVETGSSAGGLKRFLGGPARGPNPQGLGVGLRLQGLGFRVLGLRGFRVQFRV